MKIVRLVCAFCLLVGSLLAILPVSVVLAQDVNSANETANQITESIELSPTYPKMESIAGGTFEFELNVSYFGGDAPRNFDLSTTAPQGWDVYMTPRYEKERKISAIRLEPTFGTGQTILVEVTAPVWPLPDPGEYKITLTATSGDLKTSTELTAIITAKYMLTVAPVTQLYNTKAKAGKDNYFSIEVTNLGTAAIEDINLSPSKPEGWTIDFSPQKIDKLEAFDSQTMDVNIKPPNNTIAGDYNISLRASGKQSTANEIQIRVTVESPTIWGWVGVGIIVVVIAGLFVIFMRFSRR